jgi:UDP-glucose 4-epimerase
VRALVTGGAGFIGSHLVEALLAAGHTVTVLDDLSTGRRENLRAVEEHPDLNVVMGSIRDDVLVQKLVYEADIVHHLAAAVGVQLVLDQLVDTISMNVIGTAVVRSG